MSGWQRARAALSRRPPDPVPAVLDAWPGERLLGWASTAAGELLVATDRALHVPVRGSTQRLGWESVDTAAWDPASSQLTVVTAAARGARPVRRVYRVDEPGDLVDVVRERVTATVVLTRRVEIDGRRGARVVARRPPGSDTLRWSVVVDPGLDPAEPATKARIDAEVRAARAELGG